MRQDTLIALLLIGLTILGAPLRAEEGSEEEEVLGLENVSEFSLVVTDGNSSTETFGFKNTLRYHWPKAKYVLRLDAVRSNTAEDSFAVLRPGSSGDFDVVNPDKTPDVEKYLIENRYDREITEFLFWNVGITWDRNRDAGILNRFVAFAGVGNVWWDREDLRFDTSYGLSYTDREEETPDPEKDDQFMGFRFAWSYLNKFGRTTTYGNDWSTNVSLSDTSDWSSDMTNWVAVAMNSRLALKVSLQWLYNALPAFEGLPLYAIDDSGSLVEVGSVDVRKEKLDTVFTTSIVINF